MRFNGLPQRLLLATALIGLLSAADQAPGPAWPQTTSDLPADPAVKYGILPSGMRYVIMKNTTPSGEVSLRLRMATGSLEESDAQQGLAHYLEHMAFRGSSRVADGEVFKTLERLGLRAGADTNASTSQTQTVYQFDLPRADEETLNTGLMLTREIVSELKLDPAAAKSEAGPVLSEERLRDSPGTHSFEAQNHFLLKGQLAPDRQPIGKVEIIRNAPVDQIENYYHTYYRPERTTLFIVGDIDPDAVEAKIRARFADWTPSGEGKADPDLGTPISRGQEALVFVETGAPQYATVSWVGPYDSTPDTAARRAHNRIEGIGLQILNQRFAQAVQVADAPFLAAGSSLGNTARSAKIASLYVSYAADHWQRALGEADKIRRQVLAQGVTQQEVDRQVTLSMTAHQQAIATESTRTSRGLVGGLLGALSINAVVTSPETDLALAQADLKGLTADKVNAALREVFKGQGPLLFLSSPAPVPGGEAELASVFAGAENAVLADAAPQQIMTWPYTDFGTPGTVAETRRIEDLDVTFIRFANGTKLTVKPTKFRADQVAVSVTLPGGQLVMPKDKQFLDMGALVAGGLEAMNSLDVRRSLTGKIYGVGFNIGDDSFSFSGGTRPADLDTQMQVLAAYLTKPGWRPELYKQSLIALADGLAKLDSNPTSLFGAKWQGYLHSGDARWAYPTLEDVQKAQLDDIKAVLQPALATGPIEVTMVGDVTVEQATKAVAATFGAMPARMPASYPAPVLGDVRFPDPTPAPIVVRHNGRADQGVAAIAWPTTDIFSDSESAARRLLTVIIRSRLFDQLRTADGATYSPQTGASASLTFPGYGYISAVTEIPPDKTQLFFDAVSGVIRDLIEHGPTADEFERARKPELDSLEKAVETNGYWAGFLTGIQADERRLKLIRDAKPGLESVTAADVQRVAAKYLTDAKALKVLVLPKQ